MRVAAAAVATLGDALMASVQGWRPPLYCRVRTKCRLLSLYKFRKCPPFIRETAHTALTFLKGILHIYATWYIFEMRRKNKGKGLKTFSVLHWSVLSSVHSAAVSWQCIRLRSAQHWKPWSISDLQNYQSNAWRSFICIHKNWQKAHAVIVEVLYFGDNVLWNIFSLCGVHFLQIRSIVFL